MKYSYDWVASTPTADVVLFGVEDGKLKILLIKRNNPKEAEFDKYALPGGYLNCDTELELVKPLSSDDRV